MNAALVMVKLNEDGTLPREIAEPCLTVSLVPLQSGDKLRVQFESAMLSLLDFIRSYPDDPSVKALFAEASA